MITFSIIQKSQLEEMERIDAEYFQLKYLRLVENIKKYKNQTLKSFGVKIVSGPFGSSLKSEAYLNEGVPFIRINDLDEFFINLNTLTYISKADNDRLKQSQLFSYDLVLSKVGNSIGLVSYIPKEFSVCNISENNIGIKFSKDTSLEYKLFLLTFLNSKIGLMQILRSISGNAQPKINIKDVEKVIFPYPQANLLTNIASLISSANNIVIDSKNSYQQAEDLLLDELGLKDFQVEEDLSFVVNLSDVKSASRIDSDYFQPKYQKLVEQIKKNRAKPLGDLVSMKKGFEPGSEAYQEEGKHFIRVSSLSNFGIETKDKKYLSDDLYQKLINDYQPKVNEILLTKDATPGIAYVVKEPIEGLISGGILRLKLKEDVNNEYLALCINSIVGQMQAERDSGGSIIAHWRPEQIKELSIPILPQAIQKKIAGLVIKSHEARKKSKELLEEAKRKVEEMIEKGGD